MRDVHRHLRQPVRPRYAVERKSEMPPVSNNFLDFDDNFLAVLQENGIVLALCRELRVLQRSEWERSPDGIAIDC